MYMMNKAGPSTAKEMDAVLSAQFFDIEANSFFISLIGDVGA